MENMNASQDELEVATSWRIIHSVQRSSRYRSLHHRTDLNDLDFLIGLSACVSTIILLNLLSNWSSDVNSFFLACSTSAASSADGLAFQGWGWLG